MIKLILSTLYTLMAIAPASAQDQRLDHRTDPEQRIACQDQQCDTVGCVLVDKREFFGEDPTLTLRNLPAEIIEKIEVFYKLSNQAESTGFKGGNTEKTMNIITQAGMPVEQFGKLFGGYGTEDRYQSGGSGKIFTGNQRLSLIGLANNINQQNFAAKDLLCVIDTPDGRRDGAGGRALTALDRGDIGSASARYFLTYPYKGQL